MASKISSSKKARPKVSQTGLVSTPPKRSAPSKPAAADTDRGLDLSSSDRVVEYITNNIMRGRFVPGQRLVEMDFTRTLNVSRGPVREALKRLDALGIVSREAHRGAIVAQFTRQEAIDLMQAVEPLGGLIAKLAARRISTLKLTENVALFNKALEPYLLRQENSDDLLNQRREFYNTLMTISGNSQLPLILPTMRIQLLRMQFYPFFDSEDRMLHIEEYAGIANAVAKGDASQAEKLTVQHLRRIRQAIADLSDEAFARSEAATE